MNIDEFIDKLAKMRDRKNWRFERGDLIRAGEGGLECPITSLKDRRGIYVLDVSREIDLDVNDACQIIAAADNLTPHSTILREKLLVATGLK